MTGYQPTVWVLGANIEVIRADQITRLFVPDTGRRGSAPGTLMNMAGGVSVCAEIPGSDLTDDATSSRVVELLRCHSRHAPAVLIALVNAVGSAGEQTDEPTSLYVYPVVEDDGKVHWRCSPSPPNSWPNIERDLIEWSARHAR